MDSLSAEIRWFFPISETGIVLDWFHPGDDTDQEAERTDEYLKLGGLVESAGNSGKASWRSRPCSGRLNLSIGGPAAGRTDRWMKWSANVPGVDLKTQGVWHSVAKLRWLRKYSFDGGFHLADRSVRPAEGCNLEFTILTLNGGARQGWSSICFEAFGTDPGNLRGYLQTTVEAAFRERSPRYGLSFDVARSMSYPVWLNRL